MVGRKIKASILLVGMASYMSAAELTKVDDAIDLGNQNFVSFTDPDLDEKLLKMEYGGDHGRYAIGCAYVIEPLKWHVKKILVGQLENVDFKTLKALLICTAAWLRVLKDPNPFNLNPSKEYEKDDWALVENENVVYSVGRNSLIGFKSSSKYEIEGDDLWAAYQLIKAFKIVQKNYRESKENKMRRPLFLCNESLQNGNQVKNRTKSLEKEKKNWGQPVTRRTDLSEPNKDKRIEKRVSGSHRSSDGRKLILKRQDT